MIVKNICGEQAQLLIERNEFEFIKKEFKKNKSFSAMTFTVMVEE